MKSKHSQFWKHRIGMRSPCSSWKRGRARISMGRSGGKEESQTGRDPLLVSLYHQHQDSISSHHPKVGTAITSSLASTLTPSPVLSIFYIEKLILLLSSFSLSRMPYISQLCPQFIQSTPATPLCSSTE